MQSDEFVRMVQERAKMTTGDAAVNVIEATLETLGERLPRDERGGLAAELPAQLKTYVTKRHKALPVPYGLEEFYNRVAGRSGLGLREAIRQSHAVMSVLQEAVSASQLQDVRRQLPAEYEELFTGEPYGPGSPAAAVEDQG